MFKSVKFYNEEFCLKNKDALIVFGDNLIKKGKAGQAAIRDCKNAYGIPTKRLPSMNPDAFFSDQLEEINIVQEHLDYLLKEHKNGRVIYLPMDGIGTGLARLSSKSPKINEMIQSFFKKALNS